MEQRTVSKVKSDTDPSKLAGYLAYVFERGDTKHELNCIGPASVSQGVKAVAAAKGMLAPKGISVIIDPSFFEAETVRRYTDDDDKKTGVRLSVERR